MVGFEFEFEFEDEDEDEDERERQIVVGIVVASFVDKVPDKARDKAWYAIPLT